MNADVKHLELDAVTSKLIACAYRVSNGLGAGFLEKVYENALAVELRAVRVPFLQQAGFTVRYREEIVGEYVPECMNYLRVTGLPIALLLNFGKPRLQFKRIVWRF